MDLEDPVEAGNTTSTTSTTTAKQTTPSRHIKKEKSGGHSSGGGHSGSKQKRTPSDKSSHPKESISRSESGGKSGQRKVLKTDEDGTTEVSPRRNFSKLGSSPTHSPRRSPSTSPRSRDSKRQIEAEDKSLREESPRIGHLDFSPMKNFPHNSEMMSAFTSNNYDQLSPKKMEMISSPRSPRQFIDTVTDSHSPSGLSKPQHIPHDSIRRGNSKPDSFAFKLFSISQRQESRSDLAPMNETQDIEKKITSPAQLVTPRKKAIRLVKEDSKATIKVSKEEDIEEIKKCKEDGIFVTKDSQGRPAILGGTTEKIINQLLIWLITEPKRKDVCRLLDIFFLSYVQFHSSEDLLLYVMGFWKLEVPEQKVDEDLNKQRSSIILFLSRWFETSISDFQGNTLVLLQQFLNLIPKKCKVLLKTKLKQVTQPPSQPTVYLFEPLKDLRLVPGKFGFLDLKPQLIADQWTLLDMQNFQKIRTVEFLQHDDLPVNYNKMLSRAAMFQRWVASEIVQNIEINKRIETYKRFVQVALIFLENNNYNGLMTLWGGLNMGCVSRLTKTKKKLPSQTVQILGLLAEKLSERGNFALLRKAIDKQIELKEPVIPWFELMNKFRNWTALYSNFMDTVKDGTQPILNFSKMTMIGDQMLEFLNIQKINSNVDLNFVDESKTDIIIRGYFEHLPTYDDEVLYKFSNQCEPHVENEKPVNYDVRK